MQYINEDTSDFVLMEDRAGEEFVALGELRGMFCPPPVSTANFKVEPNMVRVLITGVQWRNTALPKPVLDGLGRVICSTVGEAYEMKAEV
jgi:hypothetical protein